MSAAVGAPAADPAEGSQKRSNRVSIWTGGLVGIVALAGGAFLTGSSHYAASGKALKEEGIDPRVRLQALPVAAKALAYTTLVTVLVGGAALAIMHQTLQARDVTEVASLTDALAIMKQQRAAVQREFAKRLQGPPDDGNQAS